jgi:hypothetical protein
MTDMKCYFCKKNEAVGFLSREALIQKIVSFFTKKSYGETKPFCDDCLEKIMR